MLSKTGETFSAFSNGKGGTVILGLSEDKGFRPAPKFNADAIYSDMLHYGDRLTPVVRPPEFDSTYPQKVFCHKDLWQKTFVAPVLERFQFHGVFDLSGRCYSWNYA